MLGMAGGQRCAPVGAEPTKRLGSCAMWAPLAKNGAWREEEFEPAPG